MTDSGMTYCGSDSQSDAIKIKRQQNLSYLCNICQRESILCHDCWRFRFTSISGLSLRWRGLHAGMYPRAQHIPYRHFRGTDHGMEFCLGRTGFSDAGPGEPMDMTRFPQWFSRNSSLCAQLQTDGRAV